MQRLSRARRALEERLGRRVLIWGAVLLALALVLCGIPLFDLLGYDFSFVLGLATAFAAADVGHGAVAAARRAGGPLSLGEVLARAVLGALGMLALPLAVSLLNALRVRNCSLLSGLVFFALLPVGTALYAATAGALAGVLVRRRGRALALALPALSIVWSLLRLYWDPAVFALDPFGGYFPGPIYDEALRPSLRLLWFRLANVLWAGSAVAVVAAISGGGRRQPDGPPRPGAFSAPAGGLAVVLVAASAVVFALRGPLGFHVRHADLATALPRHTETAHFVVLSDPASGQSPDELALFQRDLEFRYQQLTRILGTRPPERITVYQFPSAAAKKELVGAGNTLYAKPWTREVFIQVDRFPAGHLRHELAHVFAAGFGDPLFGVSFAIRFWGPLPVPRLASGLIEGVAEAADYGDPEGRATIHREARAMMAAGRAPPLRSVVGAGFTTQAGARAYTLAGSFCHFLLLQHGAERLRALYHSAGDFLGVYGVPLEVLEQRWRAFLERQPLDAVERARAQERFRRPAIFSKVCARELAARVTEARSRMYITPERAVSLLQSACTDDPGEPTFRLDLADALIAAGRTAEALALAGEIEADPTLASLWPLRARAASLGALLRFHAGKFPEAAAAVRRALEVATDEGEERTDLAKLRALADPEARQTLGRVLFGDSPIRGVDAVVTLFLVERFADAFPEDALGPYLVARQLAWRAPRQALPLLARACPLTGASPARIPLTPPFLRECRRLIADTAFRAGDLPTSRTATQRLATAAAAAANEAELLRTGDFLERITWEEGQR